MRVAAGDVDAAAAAEAEAEAEAGAAAVLVDHDQEAYRPVKLGEVVKLDALGPMVVNKDCTSVIYCS